MAGQASEGRRMMTNRWTVSFSREQLDAMLAKIDIDAIIARVATSEYDGASFVLARIQELEAELAAVPVEAILTVVRSLDDGPYSDEAVDAVIEWLDKKGALEPVST